MHRMMVCVVSAWIVLQVWDSTGACLKFLKAAGYFIAATHLAPDSVPISELDWTRPTCIVMGNESYGESQRMAGINTKSKRSFVLRQRQPQATRHVSAFAGFTALWTRMAMSYATLQLVDPLACPGIVDPLSRVPHCECMEATKIFNSCSPSCIKRAEDRAQLFPRNGLFPLELFPFHD